MLWVDDFSEKSEMNLFIWNFPICKHCWIIQFFFKKLLYIIAQIKHNYQAWATTYHYNQSVGPTVVGAILYEKDTEARMHLPFFYLKMEGMGEGKWLLEW